LPSTVCDCVEVTTRLIAPPLIDQIEWRRLSWAERLRDAAPTIGLVVIPMLILVSALLVLWIKEPDPVSADPARATLARLGAPVPGAMLRSELTADWPRCGTDGACVTAGRVYQLTDALTLGGVIRDLQAWAASGRLRQADAQPADCNNLSQSGDSEAPGPGGPGCVVGLVLPEQPNQQLTVNIMFQNSSPVAAPRSGESWTKYAGKTVSQVVIDVTNIRPGTD
jgi:hypothetical protein